MDKADPVSSQDIIATPEKAHTHSVAFLSSLLKIAVENVGLVDNRSFTTSVEATLASHLCLPSLSLFLLGWTWEY